MSIASHLLQPDFLRRLERLAVAARRVSGGPFPGEHASTRQGGSVEFADFRNYVPGDDFRHIDWNAYGRLDRLFLKLFREESELSVYVLLDRSASMGLVPAKIHFARQVAAALAYVSLCNFDRVTLGAVDERLAARLGPVRGKAQATACFRFLEAQEAGGVSDLERALREFASSRPRRGICVVVSDFLQERDAFAGLRALRLERHEVYALQVLDPEELDPAMAGDLRLVDAETEAVREVTVTPAVLAAYRRVIQAYVRDLEERCRGYGIGYALAPTSARLEDLVFQTLRREGLVD